LLSAPLIAASGNAALQDAEERIRDAEFDVTRGFFSIGEALKKIRDGELWKQAGARNWGDYCQQRRINYSKRYSNKLIRMPQNRELLADLSGPGHICPTWTVTAVEELHRLSEPNDIRRVSKKAATRVKNGAAFSTRLVHKLVDDDLGLTRQRKEAKQAQEAADYKRLYEPPTVAATLSEWGNDINSKLRTLESLDESLWDDALNESSDVLRYVENAAADLAAFLKAYRLKTEAPRDGNVSKIAIAHVMED